MNNEQEIHDRIARALRSDDGKYLVTKLQDRRVRTINELKAAHDLIDIGRHQGFLEFIDWVLNFREE